MLAGSGFSNIMEGHLTDVQMQEDDVGLLPSTRKLQQQCFFATAQPANSGAVVICTTQQGKLNLVQLTLSTTLKVL